jgi:hypothetical protein
VLLLLLRVLWLSLRTLSLSLLSADGFTEDHSVLENDMTQF